MSKKDFISLADALRGLDVSESVLYALCFWMAANNPLFKRERWLNYLAGRCGPNGGRVKD